MLTGSCACGRVKYQIQCDLIGPITYCHCWRCRAHSGSSFGTTAGVVLKDLCFTAGENLLSYWESSPGIRRYFAGCCGSPIYKTDQASPSIVGLRLGTLDCDPGVTVQQHYMVASKAPWVQIQDSLAQEAGDDPPFPQRA